MTFTKKNVSVSQGPDPRSSIQKERDSSKWNPQQMNYFLEGSVERSELMKALAQQMERDPILFTDGSYYDLTKDQQRELTAVKINRIARYREQESIDTFNKRLSLIGIFDPQVGTRIGVNLGLFLSCIRGNGTTSQLNYWANEKETADVKGIYGCFGMTELAHGSNVAGLETTATFDKESDEFVINTPHIGATKWWIGGAAHSATHCSVYARLIVDGQDYGVKTFVVPLRDSNHDLMPGVTVGDIGAKMGRDGIDNGWIPGYRAHEFWDFRIGFIKTQFEIFQLVSKIFLKKIDDLKFEEVEKIWFGLLENFKNLKIYSNDGYNENCIELIKNMILVLQNIKFLDQTENAQIYKASCDKMDEIYPQLKKEFMESGQPEAKQEEANEEVKQEEEGK
ncbi:Acyl-coenzyme A oxidase 4 [Candida viswanathii]|uniref:Acyl-coenzyme A oxidase 4 n=1 Tax=Candida viswanathii TaxID=5486 RepID=A0A367XWV9_9ASCO|nr:Acyl-coenzyme A oxidase 4 [Candida viswanathii]